MKTYSFESQNILGKQGEVILDQWISKKYKVTDVSNSSHFRERCIDRVIERSDGTMFFAEYKFDKAARRTKNIFFETVSVDSQNIPGWGWKTQADYLIILVPDQELLIFRPDSLRALLWENRHSVEEKSVANVGYRTIGYPIALAKVREKTFFRTEIQSGLELIQPPIL